MDVQYQKKYTVNQGCISLSTYYLEYGCHVARLHRRRRRAYEPTNNTAVHNNHEKINSWVSFSLYGYGAPLGGPSGHRSSAISMYMADQRKINRFGQAVDTAGMILCLVQTILNNVFAQTKVYTF